MSEREYEKCACGTDMALHEPGCGEDANPPAPRCKHDVHGTDCFECYPPTPSGEDERDAKKATREWANDRRKLMGYRNGTLSISENDFESGFLAGRKGMVPAAEVERLKAALGKYEIEGVLTTEFVQMQQLAVSSAVKAERERCAKAADEKLRSIMAGNLSVLVDSYRSQVRAAILNPPEAE